MSETGPIALISALPQELEILLSSLNKTSEQIIGGFKFSVGTIENQKVVLAHSAAGKVNSAALTTLLLHVFSCRAVLFSGVAGGLNPKHNVGDLVIAEQLIQYDYGATINRKIKPYHPGDHCIGPATSELPFEMEPVLLARLKDELGDSVIWGRVLTGDQFVNCEGTRIDLFDTFNADAVEMEGAAIAQVARRFNIPWVIVRSLSDLAGDESDRDFTAFLAEASKNAAALSLQVIRLI